MTGLIEAHDVLTLAEEAERAGLAVLARAAWPEEPGEELPKLAGFVHSSFNPLVAAAATRCLQRRPESASPHSVTAIVLVTALGDVASATHVAEAVDAGGRIGPLFFFQSVPNAVAGHLAARHRLTGPVVCVATVADGLAVAGLLLDDGDADEALVVRVEQAGSTEDAVDDTAAAVLVAGPQHSDGGLS